MFWKPIFNVLKSHFTVLLGHARHLEQVPGHKTDQARYPVILPVFSRHLMATLESALTGGERPNRRHYEG